MGAIYDFHVIGAVEGEPGIEFVRDVLQKTQVYLETAVGSFKTWSITRWTDDSWDSMEVRADGSFSVIKKNADGTKVVTDYPMSMRQEIESKLPSPITEEYEVSSGWLEKLNLSPADWLYLYPERNSNSGLVSFSWEKGKFWKFCLSAPSARFQSDEAARDVMVEFWEALLPWAPLMAMAREEVEVWIDDIELVLKHGFTDKSLKMGDLAWTDMAIVSEQLFVPIDESVVIEQQLVKGGVWIKLFSATERHKLIHADEMSMESELSDEDYYTGSGKYPKLGVDLCAPREGHLASVREQAKFGPELLRVKPDGPAHAAGLKPGDIILKVDDVPVDLHSFKGRAAVTEVPLMLRDKKFGEVVQLLVRRGDDEFIVRVQL